MFFVKKLISAFLMPTTAALTLLAIGLGVLWFSKRVRLGKILATCGFAILFVGTCHFVPDGLVAQLERRHTPLYPAAALQSAIAASGGKPRLILVLGGGEIVDPRVPANDQLSDSALSRLIEGIRLMREVPDSRLLLSGGVVSRSGGSHADRMRAVALSLGVDDARIEIDRSAWDTEQEAANLARKIGKEPFFLVTSAFHMPRAMGLFRHAGTSPIAAPTHHVTIDEPGVSLLEFFPNPGSLSTLQWGLHESLGLLWSKLRGRI
ncbi:MAG TPA: ElyC/SanA/YdcF family protein [Polyangia bacterium]